MLKLADQYSLKGEFSKAIDAYLEVIGIDNGNVSAAYGLARSYHGLSDYESAQKWYLEVARGAVGDYPDIRYHLGYCAKMMGNWMELPPIKTHSKLLHSLLDSKLKAATR